MDQNNSTNDAILVAYSQGLLGTRDAIQKLGMSDYGDLLIALTQLDLKLPKPNATPTHASHMVRASSILQPRLLNGQ